MTNLTDLTRYTLLGIPNTAPGNTSGHFPRGKSIPLPREEGARAVEPPI